MEGNNKKIGSRQTEKFSEILVTQMINCTQSRDKMPLYFKTITAE